MSFRSIASATALFLCAFLTSAHAQLTTFVTGVHTGVTAKFTFWVDPALNTLTIQVDNRYESAGGDRGMITALGFNTPFANGSSVTLLSQTWNVKVGGHNTSNWSVTSPFSLGYTSTNMEAGVKTGGNSGNLPSNGIRFGEVATFKFGMADFSDTQRQGFFSGNTDLVVRWRSITDGCEFDTFDKGFGNFTEVLPPVPEPSTYGMIGAGVLLAGVIVRRRLRR